MDRYLYRGINPELYQSSNGKLTPKSVGRQFKRPVHFDECYFDEGVTYDESETNAVIMHQKDSSKYASSGVSTTPIFENAKSYATHNEKYDSGYVYKIDTELLEKNGVKAYPVNEHAVKRAIPNDKEVILVADNLGVLPDKIVVEIIKV
jgi:NarE